MNKIDPFEVEDEGSDQENVPVPPPASHPEVGVQPQQVEVSKVLYSVEVSKVLHSVAQCECSNVATQYILCSVVVNILC